MMPNLGHFALHPFHHSVSCWLVPCLFPVFSLSNFLIFFPEDNTNILFEKVPLTSKASKAESSLLRFKIGHLKKFVDPHGSTKFNRTGLQGLAIYKIQIHPTCLY